MHPRSLVLMLAVVAGCSSSASQSREAGVADRAAIDSAMKGYATAFRSNDPARVVAWWTDDAMFINRTSPTVQGRAGLDSLVKGVFSAFTVKHLSIEKDDLDVSGDLAYYIGSYHEVLQPRTGAEVRINGRFVSILKRQSDGAWKFARLIETDLGQSGAATPVAAKDSSKTSG